MRYTPCERFEQTVKKRYRGIGLGHFRSLLYLTFTEVQPSWIRQLLVQAVVFTRVSASAGKEAGHREHGNNTYGSSDGQALPRCLGVDRTTVAGQGDGRERSARMERRNRAVARCRVRRNRRVGQNTSITRARLDFSGAARPRWRAQLPAPEVRSLAGPESSHVSVR